jgi:electron transfer flavoprotein alpha subunit
MGNLLVLVETGGMETLPTVAFAQSWAKATQGRFDILVIGDQETMVQAQSWRGYSAERVLVVVLPELAHPTADRVAFVVAQVMQQTGASALAGTSSTFGKDILPRVAGLLDLPMLSDVMSVETGGEGLRFRRPMYAGNVIATVQVAGDGAVFSVRGTAFEKPQTSEGQCVVEAIKVDTTDMPQGTEWVALEAAEQKRPELTSARVVVSGGRPLRDAETFERVLGGLADKLGGALGATRAAVDSGLAPNELQVGQTGKIVAPELYIAAGVSGSVQHLAGMKDSKVIVAINTDPDAPIFEVADYGLVADLHQAVPELTAKL